MSSDPPYSGGWWRELRDDLDARHVAAKEAQAAILHLATIYGGIPVPDRGGVDQVLLEWILSDDPTLRYDALYIVNQHMIRSVEPALRTLQ